MYQRFINLLFFIFILPALVQAESHSFSRVDLPPSLPVIKNGTFSQVPQVVALQRQDGSRFCSATVTGPRTILTAAHCAGEPGTSAVVDGKVYPIQCQKHPNYFSDDSKEKKDALRALAKQVKSTCEDWRQRGIASAQTLLSQLVNAYFQKRRDTVSLNDNDMSSDMAVCWIQSDESFTVEPACLKNYRETFNLEHIGFGTTGTDEEGKYTNDKLEEQNRGPAKLALNQKSSATIETVFDANDPNSVGICPGDSGGFLGSRVGGQSYISGIHSSASTTQLKFNDVACRFENYVISNASATSVNLYSASAQSFLNQITKSRSLEICGLNTSVPSGFASTQRPSDGATRVGQTVGASGVAPNGAGSASGTAGSGRPPVTGGNTGVAGGPSVGSPMPATLPAAKTAGLGFSLVDSPSIRITKAAPEGFAASKMGLQPGDKIIGWDGLPLAGGKDFIRRWQNLLSNPQKNSVVLTIQKADGTLKRFGIKFPVARSSYDLMARKSTRLGLFIEDEPNRASVAQISNSGMGGELRLGQGDVLLSVNDQKVTRSDEAAKAIEMAKSSDEEFKLGFLRPDGSIYSVFMDPKKIKTNPNFVATR